jgi:hypothetical protein
VQVGRPEADKPLSPDERKDEPEVGGTDGLPPAVMRVGDADDGDDLDDELGDIDFGDDDEDDDGEDEPWRRGERPSRPA